MLINENMEAKVFEIKICDGGHDHKISSFYIYVGFYYSSPLFDLPKPCDGKHRS